MPIFWVVVTKVDQVKNSGYKREISDISNDDSEVSDTYFSCEGSVIDTDDLTGSEDELDMAEKFVKELLEEASSDGWTFRMF